jgi:hypothetical protein
LLWGFSMALHEGSEFVNGQPKDTKLDTYRLLRMADVPEVEIEFLPARKPRLGSASRRRPPLRRRLEMRSLPLAGRACRPTWWSMDAYFPGRAKSSNGLHRCRCRSESIWRA